MVPLLVLAIPPVTPEPDTSPTTVRFFIVPPGARQFTRPEDPESPLMVYPPPSRVPANPDASSL